MSDDRPVTKGRRFLRLAGMTASVAGQYAKSRIKSVFQTPEAAAAERATINEVNGALIAKTLGELKGAVMKVGQMASIASDILPRELAEPLKALQKEAPPMAYEVIAEQVEAELGAPPETLFQRFDREPFASASIGQVHRAITDDGREVVVKVQYPGVDGAVDSDLAHLKLVLRAGGLMKVKKQDMDAVFREVRARLMEELDYCNEADNVRLFREYHQRHPFVVIPDVVGERSSQRVLTLTYEAGDSIDSLTARGYTQALRDQIGVNLFRVMAEQLFDFRTIHADPNPGNLAVRPDGTLVLYDFGCVKKIPREIIEAYKATIRAGLAEDYPGVERGLRALGVRRVDGPPVPHQFYKRWRDAFARPFVGDEPFDYGASTIHEDVMPLVPGSLKMLDSFKPPPDLVFIDRMVVGHYGNLRAIGARGRFMDLLRPYL
ncbi:MAG: AarF/ABC1/UbiB kinase family protein [Myxococcales bacterium]|nr:AarF/ABC1/UbiB kinase family protein [Myxococcales bacterium]